MPIRTYEEIDLALYEHVGGATNPTKGFISAKFNNAALYMGSFASSDDPSSEKRHFPCVQIEFKNAMPERSRLHAAEEYYESTTTDPVPVSTVTEGPIPYQALYMIHVYTRKTSDTRNMRSVLSGLFSPLGSMVSGDDSVYYEIIGQYSSPDDEMYGDQIVLHEAIELVVYFEMANLQTRSYKQVVQANLEVGDVTLTLTET